MSGPEAAYDHCQVSMPNCDQPFQEVTEVGSEDPIINEYSNVEGLGDETVITYADSLDNTTVSIFSYFRYNNQNLIKSNCVFELNL